MPIVSAAYHQFDGLFPAVSHVQKKNIAVIRGRNFRWNAAGPYSGWGNRVVSPAIPSGSEYVATFRIEDHVLVLSPSGAWRMETECKWEKICTFDAVTWDNPCDNDYPWSSAYVGDTWFFAHPKVGIVAYSKCEDKWTCQVPLKCHVDAVTSHGFLDGYEDKFPAVDGDLIAGPIFSITQAHNRLIVLARDTVSWSEPDRGLNLCADIHCGGGFQSLSVLRYGQPLAVKETNSGFMTYTTNGMGHFTTLGNAAQFRYDHVSHTHVPINPWAICSHDAKVHYFVSEHGTFQTDGTYPKPWLQEIGAYLVEREIPLLTKRVENFHAIAMWMHPESGEVFISLVAPENPEPHIWTRSFVFDEHYEKVGSFDQRHRWIGPTNFTKHRKKHDTFGFIGDTYHIHEFDLSYHNSIPTDNCSCNPIPLDSFVEFGLFRVPDENTYQDSELQQFTIQTAGSVWSKAEIAQHSTALTQNSYEDQALNEYHTHYNLHVASSSDGYSFDNAQWEYPMIVKSTPFNKTYSCQTTGIYHTIKIVADRLGDFYEVTSIKIDSLRYW